MKKFLIIALLALSPVSMVLAQNTKAPKKKSKTVAAANVAAPVIANPAANNATIATGASTVDVAAGQTVQWNETTHDFGKIEQGVPVTTEFKFTNTSKAPLIIANVQPSCGCTAADFSKSVAPGQTGYVKATFNAANPGSFSKSITVISNAPEGNITLNIKGEVTPK